MECLRRITFGILFVLVGLQCRATADSFSSVAAKADAARDADHLDEAVVLYHRALALHSSWKEGWWSLGTIDYDRDAYAKAVPSFQHLIRIDPRNGTAYVMLGLCQFELGADDNAALKNIQTGLGFGLLKNEALRKVVLYHEGVLLLRQGKFGGAREALSLLASYGGREDQAALALGMAALLIRPKDLPAEDSRQREVVLQAGRAETLGTQKQTDAGSKIYADLVSANPDFPNLHYARGRFLLLANETDEAIPEFQNEIKNNPRHMQSYLNIAAVYYRVDSATGILYATDAVRLYPEAPFGHYLLGLLYVDIHEYEKAVPELEMAQKHMNREPDIYYALGTAYAHLNRKEDAARARATFRRLSAQTAGKDEPNIYGENPPLRAHAERGKGDAKEHD